MEDLAAVPADLFGAGSRWAGTYVFTLRKEFGGGTVELTVTSRHGNNFVGTYTTRSATKPSGWGRSAPARGVRCR